MAGLLCALFGTRSQQRLTCDIEKQDQPKEKPPQCQHAAQAQSVMDASAEESVAQQGAAASSEQKSAVPSDFTSLPVLAPQDWNALKSVCDTTGG